MAERYALTLSIEISDRKALMRAAKIKAQENSSNQYDDMGDDYEPDDIDVYCFLHTMIDPEPGVIPGCEVLDSNVDYEGGDEDEDEHESED